jgi:crossover junction endodeoxyribonuclease RusA
MRSLFWLPYPPSMNHYWRNFRGHTVISREGREFRQEVAEIATSLPKFGSSRLKITMLLRPRDARRIDLDNRIKAVLDALEHSGIFENDYQVDHVQMIRGQKMKGGALHVLIEEVNPSEYQRVALQQGEG